MERSSLAIIKISAFRCLLLRPALLSPGRDHAKDDLRLGLADGAAFTAHLVKHRADRADPVKERSFRIALPVHRIDELVGFAGVPLPHVGI
jgi:hypothetical protein